MFLELPVIDSSSAADRTSEEPRYWRSLQQRESRPENSQDAANEFAPGALDEPSGHSRRTFMQVMAASMAFAGLTACRRPVETIMPYTRMPEEIIPGIPMRYATAMPMGKVVRGLVVESHEGRPTKVEGNPDHPVSQGATSLFEQASILNLYDPDRSRAIEHEGQEVTWPQFVDFCRTYINQAAGARVAVISEATSSPTLSRLRNQFLQSYPNAQWVTYEAGGDDHVALGAQLAFGRPLRPQYFFSEADVIVSLDADFTGPSDPNSVHNSRELAASRRLSSPDETISRLYVVESMYSGTGAAADHRLRLRSSDVPAFASALAAALGVEGAAATGQTFADHPWIPVLADDLRQAGSRGVVVPGQHQPPVVHALCAAMNQVLGAYGSTVQLLETGEEQVIPQFEALQELVADMNRGEIDAVFFFGTNPVYDAPSDLDFATALANVPDRVHLGEWFDETAALCNWHVPRTHYLEMWGDGRAFDGTLSVIQPLIAPLYDSHSDLEVLNLLATGRDVNGYDLVRETWRQTITGTFEEGWNRVLHDGLLPGSGYAVASATPVGVEAALDELSPAPRDEVEVGFRLSPTVYDGRYSNNAWMQECPHPITKIVWDNVAIMSPATARQLGVSTDWRSGHFYSDVVELAANGRSVEIPVWILPGHADNAVTVHLGYGRQIRSKRRIEPKRLIGPDTDVYRPGPIGNGVGTNVAVLRTTDSFQIAHNAEIRRVGGDFLVATTQEHGSMEGRPIVRSGTTEDFRENPTFAFDMVPPFVEPWTEYPALWEEEHPRYSEQFSGALHAQNQWGMVIDLNACTGCKACVVACQSENNIQVVGKEQVSRGRNMHWLRIDRYFTGDDAEDPGMVMQPMMCVHCDNAPCEPVCPVAATTTSPDGINEMTYNRCIGTRYCSNNCPYKVRRFNFFNWTRTLPETVQMAQNPNVTVRFRGVMEKCTYCVHRIRRAGQHARRQGLQLRDGDVQTACAQACPSRAITFGDISDPQSEVSRQKQNPRRYEVLAELNTQPRTSYLARIRNPNPRLEQTA